MSNLAMSLIRTWVPIAAAAAATWVATRWGIVLPQDLSGAATAWVVAGAAAAYYYAARRLEQVRGRARPARVARWLGRWLLGGVVPAPTYTRGVPSR